MLLTDKLYLCVFNSGFSQLRNSAFALQDYSYSFRNKHHRAVSCVCQSRTHMRISVVGEYISNTGKPSISSETRWSEEMSSPNLRRLQNGSCVCVLHVASEITHKLQNNFPSPKQMKVVLVSLFPSLAFSCLNLHAFLERLLCAVTPRCPCPGNAVPGAHWNAGLLKQVPPRSVSSYLDALLHVASRMCVQSSVNAARDEHVGTGVELHRMVPCQPGFSPLRRC